MQNISLAPISSSSVEMKERFRLIVEEIEKSVNESSIFLENATLNHGWLGASLFYCYYAQYTKEDTYYQKGEAFLEKALNYSGYKYYKKNYPTDSYDANIAALGIFLIKSSENNFLDFDLSPYIKNIEDTLHALCVNKLKHADFSIFSGALATGVFLLRTEPSVRNNALLCDIVESIEKNAVSDSSGGIYWTSPRLENKVYLGLSHGSGMMISFLCDVHDRGLIQEKCRTLIDGAINFVLKQKRDNPKGIFPHFLNDHVKDTQFSLCYGDLGTGFALLKGSLVLNDHNLITESKEILQICSHRRFEDRWTLDAGMTYGASGIAYLYEKLHQLDPTNDVHLKSYEYWILQIPKYSRANNSYCGFQSFFKPDSDVFNLSYGWGVIGIGITLMRYLDRNLPITEGINHGI